MTTIEAIKAVLNATSSYGGANNARDTLHEIVAAYDALAPDWAQAPDWAKWSAIHANGLRFWFALEPECSHGYTGWNFNGGRMALDKGIKLPIGIDWRLCKWQRRPEVTP